MPWKFCSCRNYNKLKNKEYFRPDGDMVQHLLINSLLEYQRLMT